MRYSLVSYLALFAIVHAVEKRGGKEPCCNVKISPEQVPVLTEPLPVLKLCDQVVVPPDYLNGIIKNVAPGAELEAFGPEGASAAFEDEKLVAFVRPDTGESRVFPSFDCLKPGTNLAELATTAANQLLTDTTLFPKDDTTLIALPPTILSSSKSCEVGNATAPEELLAFVRIQRQVNGLPVDGPGTQAAIAVDEKGCIVAFAHRYRPAFFNQQSVTPHCPDEIVSSIIDDLSDTCTRDNVTISNIVVRYHDAGADFIQPVYSYGGQIGSVNTSSHSQITGDISVGSAVEPIKPIPQQDFPTNAPAGFYRYARSLRVDPTVGRYVVRADSFEWIDSATAFFTNLQLASTFGGNLSFTDSQYLAADPDMFIAQKNAFINSVQIALNEVHGDWGEFTTYKSFGDIVTLSAIGAAGGLGANAGGSLAYWILHSCEVIPTQTDEETSFDVWWQIFKGLHSAVGYRTDMYIDDEVTTNFGLYIGLGASIVPAWFLEVVASNVYEESDATYFDNNRGFTEPLGRPSSVSVCGHVDDTAYDVAGLENPKCLVEFWLEN